MLDFLEMCGSDACHGVPDAEGGKNEPCAAADADEHHEQSPFIAEHVAQRNLLEKGELIPEKREPLQKNFPSDLGSTGTKKLGRSTLQLIPAGEPGAAKDSCHGGKERRSGKNRTEQILQRSKAVHRGIGAPEYLREAKGSEKKSGGPAGQGCASCIQEIFPDDGSVSEAGCLENADLRALLLNHACHGGHADQHGNQDKEQRKNIGDPAENRGVVLEGDIAGVFLSCQKIGFRLFDSGCLRHFLREVVLFQNILESFVSPLPEERFHGAFFVLALFGVRIAVGRFGILDRHVQLGIDVICLKGILGQIQKTGERADSDGRSSPLVSKIQRRVRKSDKGEGGFGERKVITLHFKLRSDVRFGKICRISQAFMFFRGKSSGLQRRKIDFCRQGDQLERNRCIARCEQGIRAEAPLCSLHIGSFGKDLHVILCKSERGDQPVIVKMLLRQVVASGFRHGVSGDLQAGEEADAQHDDQKYCQIPHEGGADVTQR